MKARNFVILAALAAALAFLAYRSHVRREQTSAPLIGAKVLPNLPVNNVGKMVITAPGSTVIVARIKEKWCVPSRYNYPASFEKVSDAIRELADMTVGQAMNASAGDLKELELLKPGETGAAAEAGGAGSLVELMDGQEQLLGYLVIGKSFFRRPPQGQMQGFMDFGSRPDGQYVRTSDNKVYLVSQTLQRVKEDAKTWLDDEFINVSDSDVAEITVTGPDRDPVRLLRREQGEMGLQGLDQDAETLDMSKVNQLTGALRYLSFDDVASPALTPDQTGLDQPVLFTARTKQGQVYTIEMGKESEDASSRYMRARIEYQAPAPAADATNAVPAAVSPENAGQAAGKSAPDGDPAEKTEALNAKLSKWTYMVRPFRAAPLLLKRADLVSKTEKKEEEKEELKETADMQSPETESGENTAE